MQESGSIRSQGPFRFVGGGLEEASKKESHEEFIENWLLTGLFIVIIISSIIFEVLVELLQECLRHRGLHKLQDMLTCAFKELTILGFISLFLYCATRLGAVRKLNDKYLGVSKTEEVAIQEAEAHGEVPYPPTHLTETFETIHVLIFMIMVAFIVQVAVLTAVGYRTMKELEYLDAKTSDDLRKDVTSLLEGGYGYKGSVRKALEHWGIKRRFISATNPLMPKPRRPEPGFPKFSFAAYLIHCFGESLSVMIELPPSILVLTLLIVVLLRPALSLPGREIIIFMVIAAFGLLLLTCLAYAFLKFADAKVRPDSGALVPLFSSQAVDPEASDKAFHCPIDDRSSIVRQPCFLSAEHGSRYIWWKNAYWAYPLTLVPLCVSFIFWTRLLKTFTTVFHVDFLANPTTIREVEAEQDKTSEQDARTFAEDWFRIIDTTRSGYLQFDDFKAFVVLLGSLGVDPKQYPQYQKMLLGKLFESLDTDGNQRIDALGALMTDLRACAGSTACMKALRTLHMQAYYWLIFAFKDIPGTTTPVLLSKFDGSQSRWHSHPLPSFHKQGQPQIPETDSIVSCTLASEQLFKELRITVERFCSDQLQQQRLLENGGPDFPFLHLWEIWQRGSMTPLSRGETWYIVNEGFLQNLQQEANRLKSRLSPEAVAQALSGLDKFVELSKQRLEQQRNNPPQSHLRIVNAQLLSPESVRKGFATKRTRLAAGVEKQMGIAFQVCEASTWTVLCAWVPHDIEIPRGVYKQSGHFHVEVQPLLLHAFKAVGNCSSCKETVAEPVSQFAAARADSLDFTIHKLKELVAVEAYDASLHFSLELREVPGGSLAAPASSWNCVWEASETFLEDTDVEDGAGLVLLHRSACRCSRKEAASAEEDEFDDAMWEAERGASSMGESSAVQRGGGAVMGVARGSRPLCGIRRPTLVASAPSSSESSGICHAQSLVDVWLATGGLVGLVNLANTCFMNAAVQCLSVVLPFTRYFLSGAYKAHINEQNCMGTQGRLANAYAKTLKALWASGDSAFAPRELKWAVGEVREEFLGFAQQDSQELLAFLLDGIHEDLNRDKIEGAEGASDSVTALRSWQRHKEIHDSMVVDLFQGQYRSQLVCPQCRRLSVTFDPFLNLSLPLPNAAPLRFNIAGCFETSKAFAAEMQAKLPLSQAQTKELALQLLNAAMKGDMPHANLMEEEKEELRLQICHCVVGSTYSTGRKRLFASLSSRVGKSCAFSTGVKSLNGLREDNVLLICRRIGEMTPGSPLLANGLKPFCPGEELRSKTEKRLTSIFVWFLPSRTVRELEGQVPLDTPTGATSGCVLPSENLTAGDPRVIGSWMPVLRLVTASTTCSDLYAAAENAFFLPGASRAEEGTEASSGALAISPRTSFSPEEGCVQQQKSKISGVFTQAVEAINKTFGPAAHAEATSRKWRLQAAYPFAADDVERSVLGQGVAYIRDKLGGQLRVIPNEGKPLLQHVRPLKGQLLFAEREVLDEDNMCRWSRSKITTRVCFPYKNGEYLDMSQFILPGGLQQLQEEDPSFSPEYELIGVNVHSGELGGGHYYAYTKIRGQWALYLLCCITRPRVCNVPRFLLRSDKCHSADAYMLTYELRSSRENSKSRLAIVETANRLQPVDHQVRQPLPQHHQPTVSPWVM
ncbi:ubiquitin carboxyl-terminal [Cyclospora cayetanensis]|uniref:Ubiquitin carboxyl-terminal n=1 Tax=Cyclospora cayetanensis TaxID=88456 RepID=A0A1D3CSZ2_9EIME|nr:ubiquitin carboxyl-terminal [Cyclospora cayetanensis]